ncbi:MAG: hypothetical protein AB7H71_10265 [Alphaproteobacteria bacterium]
MKRLIAPALAAMIACVSPASAWLAQKPSGAAPTYQVFMALTHSYPSDTVDNYIPLNYAAAASATDGPFSVFPVAGTVSTIRVRNIYQPVTGAKTWVITLRKNGSDTALTCTITSASGGVCSFSTPISFAAGDYASIKIHPTGTPDLTRLQVTTLFQPAVANDTIIPTFANGFSNSATQAAMPFTNIAPGAPAARRSPVFADGGTVDRLYVVSNAPGAAASGKKYDYTLDKNASTTAVTCQILETATACNDTAHGPVSVTGASGSTASDDVEIQAAPTSTPTAAIAGMAVRYIPVTAGHFLLPFTNNGSDDPTTTFYAPLTGSDIPANGGGESFSQSRALAMTIKRIAVKVGGAPGVGKSRVFTLRKNSVDTACTVTIADAAIAATASCNISVADDDLLSTSDAPSGSPTGNSFTVTYLAVKP